MNKLIAVVVSFFMINASVGVANGEANMDKIKSKGYAVFNKDGEFEPYEFERHPVGDNDVLIKTWYAGICHSDIHHVRSEWREEKYPMVPGHEIVGEVVQVGKKVTKFKVGDFAGVGCLVNGCGECIECNLDHEQYCPERTMTYASPDRYHGGELTMGGYSNNIVVSERYAIKIPEAAREDIDKIAPLLCAGVTTYSPIQYSRVSKGDKVAVAGFGGLGHMGVQYLVKLEADVTVFDVSKKKRAIAMKMGAKEFVDISKNPEFFKDHMSEFQFILSTIPAKYDMQAYLKMLKFGGEFAIVGLPANENTSTIDVHSFVYFPNRKIYGSQIGGIRETQEVVDYSVKNRLYPMVKVIKGTPEEVAKQITEAYNTVVNGDVQFRFVIDVRDL